MSSTVAPALACDVPGARAAIGRAWLRAFGWQVEGGRPDVNKAVVVAAPHTSNWDLTFTLAVAWTLGVKISWIGKHTLFKPPFGTMMRLLDGIPVDRRTRNNFVAAAIDLFTERDELLLIVPPEGTRGQTDRWKTGFYYIAQGANVPVILGFVDYGKRRGGLGTLFVPSGDLARDEAIIREFYSGVKGKFPERQCAVRFANSSDAAEKIGAGDPTG